MCNEYFCEHTKRFIYIFLSITFYGTRFLFGFFRHILHKICIFAKINHFLTFLNSYLFKIGLFLLTLFATNTFVTHCIFKIKQKMFTEISRVISFAYLPLDFD